MKKDIYYNVNYGRLYEKQENGELEHFLMECKWGKIEHIFIKRAVKGTDYFDLITPYGYGGPLIVECVDKAKLIQKFENEFALYCAKNNVVSEFIRFHPIFENALDFSSMYETIYLRHTVGTNLIGFDDPVQEEFSKSVRKDIRKAEQRGVCGNPIVCPKNLETFKRLYDQTMVRNNADAYYFFSNEYYEFIIQNMGEHVLEIQLEYENEIIASEIYFIEGDVMHAHLLGSSEKMLELNAGALLEATAARWGKENGYKFIHHGGGRTNDEDDSLYTYKKKYGKNTTFDFYIGKKIWNQSAYNELVTQKKRNSGNDLGKGFFPEYRS